MRKYIIPLLILILLTSPSMANAHTGLSKSIPANGQEIAEPLDKITLTFEGSLEKISTMTVYKNGSEHPLENVEVSGLNLIGSFSEPLEKGSYIIDWQVTGKDGHPISGKLNFTVIAETETETDSKSDAPPITVSEEGNKKNNKGTEPSKPADSQKESKKVESAENQKLFIASSGFIGLLFLIIGVALFLSLRKK
ncbi:copper resistance CopC family protein [Bacillus sp. EB01]|uniref:copper resistance CopC family protein n=1 Tax=Bacillus sp. EB01 TaxID=1347086 RepID=UPI0005C5133F|nr:copper resistance CopC family protein [Bacillus sp. EB01]